MSFLPGEVKENLTSLRSCISQLSRHLQPLQECSSISQLDSQLPQSDLLKLHVALAYALHSFHYLSLKLQGQDLTGHPVKKEIDHIKSYVGKVQKALTI